LPRNMHTAPMPKGRQDEAYHTVKSPNKKKIVLRLWQYLYRYKFTVFIALFLAVSSNLLALVGPMLSGFAIDAIGIEAGGVDFKRVFLFCTLMIVFYIISSILSYILSIIVINLGQKVVYKMREDVFEKLVDLPVGFFDTHQAGDIVSRISYDIDTVNASLSNDLLQICTSVITVIGSLIMMLSISPILVLVFVVTIPITILFTKYMTKKVHPLFRKRSAKLGELNGFIEEIISGQKTIKAYNQEDTMVGRFDKKNEEAVDAYYQADYYGSITGPGVNFFNNLSLALISVFGAVLYLFGSISLGNLSSFVLYSRKFSGPINEVANIFSEIQSTIAAAERIFRLIDEVPEPLDNENAKILSYIEGNVEMNHIKFGYNSDKIIIHNLGLVAKSGSTTAIVGHTGAGKTTLVNLLMRFYDPQGGTIEVDENPIMEVTRKSLRLGYAMVLQDTWLFHGTVFENIAYGKEDAALDDVIEAAKAAKIHSYIEALPDGYDTVLNADVVNISQGQKQLITIARAMLLDAKMLILDEATSNVDTRTELQIQKAMQKLMDGKTCFIIAHRLSTIQNADTILVVDNGEIVEQGNHDVLMRKNGVYAKLYHSQFS